MNKTLKVLKAMLSQDMQIFKYKNKQNASKIKKIMLPVVLFIIIAFAFGTYAYELAAPLSEIGLTYIMLTVFIMITTLITFIQGIYKSQGILFEGKDNDLLFSLPIKKSTILSLRIIKLLLYQLIYNLIYILPAFAIYIYFEKPGIDFYVISLLMIILLPIIPTLISSVLGYIVKGISSKTKSKKLIQSILSTVLFFIIWLFMMKFQDLSISIAKNATSINDLINKLYYPIGLYISLITDFQVLDLIKLLLINIVPFIIVAKLGSIYYFDIVSSSVGRTTKKKKSKTKLNYKKQDKIISLTKKDLTKYITSPVYLMNTVFALLIILVATIALCINPSSLFNFLSEGEMQNQISLEEVRNYLPYIYGLLIIFSSMMTSITSSSISIEGRTFSIVKSLPVSEENIFLSKILFGNIISIPVVLLSTIIFIVTFKISLINSIILIILAIVTPTLSSLFGLLANLMFPKMNAKNDTEVVKQSMSSMVGVMGGMGLAALFSLVTIYNLDSPKLQTVFILQLLLVILLDIILWFIIKTYGKKLYKKIIY